MFRPRPKHTSARRTIRRSLAFGHLSPVPAPRRKFGFPADLREPVFLFRNDDALKQHVRYRQAKAGDVQAAIQLVLDLAFPLLSATATLIGQRALFAEPIFVAPHAREASGDNAIPQVLAAFLANAVGQVDEEIVQTTKVYHTGADPMERLNRRASFNGHVQRGRSYVLVDDVTTMGGTLCDLADFIQRGGATVAGAVVIVNASRSGRLYAEQKTVRRLEKDFGDEIRNIFNIEPAALTADEAQYLIGFRTTSEIRGRSIKARKTTDLRLSTKGIFVAKPKKLARLTTKFKFPAQNARRRITLRKHDVRSVKKS